MSRIAVIGAGAWGTALASVVGRRGDHEVRLWALEKEVIESIKGSHTNELFLPGCALPACIQATHDFKDAISGAEIVVSVMPSHHCRRTFEHMAQWLQPQMMFVSATKGVENDTLLRMTQVIEEVVGRFCGFTPKIGAISGPSFAKEVAERHPTAVTVASRDSTLAARVQKDFSDPSFRVYMNDDLVGVELGGALKNVIAIAAGVVSQAQAAHHSGGNRNHVLERSAQLHAHQIVIHVNAEIGIAEVPLHSRCERVVYGCHSHRRGMPLRHLLGK